VPDEPVTVVIPTFNEVDNLPRLVPAVRSHGYRVLIVDDASPDGTGRLADAMAREDPGIAVLHRPVREGLGPAYVAGFDRALEEGAGVVVEMDADLSHPPEALPDLVGAVERGADLAIGSRYVPGGSTPDWPWHRRLVSRAGNLYARTLLGLPVRDVTAGFRAYRASALALLDYATTQASGYGFQVEMTWRAARAGLRIVEIPIVFRDRTLGSSKMNGAIVVEAMWLVTGWGLARLAARVRSARS
jgi:dolichol-phosphate mannosyltransferase